MNPRKSLFWIIPILTLSVGIEFFLLQTTTQFGGYIFGKALDIQSYHKFKES